MSDAARGFENSPFYRPARTGDLQADGRCILYWMQRSQRGRDNPALEAAIRLGNETGKPVACVFGLWDGFPGSQTRQKRFVIEGLVDVAEDLARRHVGFGVRIGRPDQVCLQAVKELRPAYVVGDENPLRFARAWQENVARSIKVPYVIVDADVVVPSALFPKEEFAARTIRPKIHRVWKDYLVESPDAEVENPWPSSIRFEGEIVEVESLLGMLSLGGAGAVASYKGGRREAERRLKLFVKERLASYDTERNEPTPYMTSEISAHLHFGHISPLRLALAVRDSGGPQESVDSFLEEMIVRRELSINFVARNPNYDSLKGCPRWALETLAKHAGDPRPHLYSGKQLEEAKTHDPLWNASQKEMMITGRMHNYLRMYWAKKILEWSPDASTAFDVALDLNDRYEMDGRDPNGYTGVAWAIGGKHDRPWGERPIFGTVRFMSYDSTRRKFDSDGYIRRVRSLEQGSLF